MPRARIYIPLIPEWDCIVTTGDGIPARFDVRKSRRPLAPFFMPLDKKGNPQGAVLFAVREPFADHAAELEKGIWRSLADRMHKIGNRARALWSKVPARIKCMAVEPGQRYAILE